MNPADLAIACQLAELCPADSHLTLGSTRFMRKSSADALVSDVGSLLRFLVSEDVCTHDTAQILLHVHKGVPFLAPAPRFADAYDAAQARCLERLAAERGWTLVRALADDKFSNNCCDFCDVDSLAAHVRGKAVDPTVVFEICNGGNLYLAARDAAADESWRRVSPMTSFGGVSNALALWQTTI